MQITANSKLNSSLNSFSFKLFKGEKEEEEEEKKIENEIHKKL